MNKHTKKTKTAAIKMTVSFDSKDNTNKQTE